MNTLATSVPVRRATAAAVALLGLALGVAACGDNLTTPAPAAVDPAASTIEVTPPGGARADGVEFVIVRVTVKDVAGQLLRGVAIVIDATGAGNTITQPPMRTGVDGVAIGSVASTVAGTKQLTVQAANGAGVVELAQRPTAVFTPVAQRLVFVAPPAGGVAGATLDPVQVAIHDNVGTVMTDVVAPVTLALLDDAGEVAMLGTATVDTVDGIATFTGLRVELAGAGYTLVATSPGLADAVSEPFTITPAAPATLAFVEQPGDVIAGDAIAPPVAVAALDVFGNVATNLTGAVTVALAAPGGATLGGTRTRALADGVARFHDLTVDLVGDAYELTAQSGDLPDATSTPFAVTAAPAARLALAGVPDPITAGAATGLTVTAVDRFGNAITDFADTVGFTATDPQAVLPSAYAFAAADLGTHTFAGVALRTAGVRTITATAAADPSITGSVTVLVAPAAATALEFTAQPPNGAAGAALGPAVGVTLRDAFGNVASATATQVTLGIASGPPGATLVGGGPRLPVGGVVAFDHVTLFRAGTYTLGATGAGLTAATSASFAVAAGAPARLDFLVEPTTTTAGVAVAPAVQVAVRDAWDNVATTATTVVTLAMATGPVGASLTGLGPMAAAVGVASFPEVTGTQTGTYTLQATAGTLAAAVSAPFDVEPAVGAQLVFLTEPSNAVAGVAVAPAIRVGVADQYGNLLPTATTAVSLELVTGPAGEVITGGGPSAAQAGVATFPAASFRLAGDHTIRATAAGGLQSAPSATFTIAPAAVAKLGFVTQPANTSPGTVFAPAIEVALQDAFGNAVPATAPPVAITLMGGDPAAVLAGGGAVAPVAGVATFAALAVDRPGGNYLLVATASGLTTAYSAPFAIFGPPHHVAFVVQPGNHPAGGTFSVTAAIKDVNDATITTDDTSEITLAIGDNPGGATLTGTVTRTVVAGEIAFPELTLTEPGTGYTLVADSGSLLPATSDPFTIYGQAAQLRFSVAPPAHVVADVAFALEVTVADADGRRVENDASEVTVAVETPAGAVLLGTVTQTAVAGRASFTDLRLRTAADYTLVATTTAPALITATPATLTVDPAAAASLVLAGVPATMTAGEPATVTVTALDAFANVATGYAGTVRFTTGSGDVTLPADYTFTVGDAGEHQFVDGVTVRSAGARTVTVTDTVTAALTASQETTVVADAATAYAVSALATAVAGTAQSITVTPKDQFGNTATGYAGTIRFTSTDPNATLPADYTFVSGDAGTHTFVDGITLRTAGTIGVTVAEEPGAAISNSQAVQVLVGPAARVAFVEEPTTTPVATIIAPAVQVAVQDAYGNPRTADNATQVTLSLHAGAPAGAVLGGTLTRTVAAGVATFANLTISESAHAYQLDAASGSLTGATSAAFDVFTTPSAGDLLITEIMHSTGGQRLRQWFEIRNVTSKVIALDGLGFEEVASSSAVAAITDATLLQPRAYFVFGASATAAENGGVTTVDYVYPSDFDLGQAGSGDLIISYGGSPIDEVAWDGTNWPHTADHAMNLSSKAHGGDASQYVWWWCDATAALTVGFGTPGTTNADCGVDPRAPLDLCRLDGPVLDLGTVTRGSTATFVGCVAEATVTDRRPDANDYYPLLDGAIGYGASATDPASWAAWTPAAFTATYTGACAGTEDEVTALVTFDTVGHHQLGYRFRFLDADGGAASAYTYCDRAGVAVPPAGNWGTVLVTQACAPGSQVVISQVYGGSNSAGPPVSTYRNDFVELHNRGMAAASLDGWSIQYASATGTGNFAANIITNLSGTIQPGQYYLVGMAGGTNGLNDLPATDATGILNLSATAGKVIIANTTTGLACNGGSTACSAGQLAQIVDLVGYGTANFYEGTAAAPATNTILAAVRNENGCKDTQINQADFAAATPTPRNSAAAVVECYCQ